MYSNTIQDNYNSLNGQLEHDHDFYTVLNIWHHNTKFIRYMLSLRPLIDAITLHIATIRQNCYTCWIRYATALVWHCNYISLWVWYRIKVSCSAYSYSLTQLDKVHIQFGWLWLRFDKIIYRNIFIKYNMS